MRGVPPLPELGYSNNRHDRPKLAREAEICLANVAMVTGYDCWRTAGEDVSIEMIIKVIQGNSAAVKKMIPDFVKELFARRECKCRQVAVFAILTDPALIPAEAKEKLSLFYSKYWDK